MEALGSLFLNFIMGFVNLLILPWHIFNWITLDTLKLQMNALTQMGMSHQFFFMVLAFVLILVAAGVYKRSFMYSVVSKLENFNGKIGKASAWFALVMMLQQVMIIAMGQIFRGNELVFSPLGLNLIGEELQWLSGQLKFYNAILIALASGYTFIEGGHVRVDLVYAACKRRTQNWIDLLGTIFLFIPSTIMLWWFSWPIAMNAMFAQKPMNIWTDSTRWRNFRFETSGTAEFSWVWAFKFMVLIFAGLMFICAVGFLLRNILALLEREKDIPTHYTFDEPTESDAIEHSSEAPSHPL